MTSHAWLFLGLEKKESLKQAMTELLITNGPALV